MKKILFCIAILSLFSCSKGNESNPSSGGCGTHNGKSLYKGPQGGCYYINSSGNKEYVDRSECNC